MYGKLLELMKTRGITPYRLSKETGITQATLSRWKNGKTQPSIETLQILADYFKVSIDSFLTDLETCEECEFTYSPKIEADIEAHLARHKRWEKAKKKFGIWSYSEREKRYEFEQIEKDISNPISKRIEAAENRIFAYFSRSVVGSDFDLSHISFKEYIPYFIASQRQDFAPDIYELLVSKYGTKPGMSGTYWQPTSEKETFKDKIKKLAPVKDEPEITFDDFTYAFLDESKELTEENKQKLLEMAKFFKQQQEKEKENN